jgi:hypothetical protein
MRQQQRILARLAWHAERTKELMGQGVRMIDASTKAFQEVTRMKGKDLQAWWDRHRAGQQNEPPLPQRQKGQG